MKSSKICRLCLKVCGANFQPVQEEILKVLLVEMDLDISVNPVNCKECLENLRECFEFKSICILTENNMIDVLESRHICKINMSQVYLNDEKSSSTLSRLEEVCRFCTKPITKFFSVDKLDEDINFSNMVEKFLPEVTPYFSNNAVCCSNCLNSLKRYFTFLKNCQDVEKHIKAYCKAENITKEKVELNNVVQYISRHDIFERNGEKFISKLKKEIINEVAVPEDQSVEPYFSYSAKTDIKEEPIIEINAANIDMDMSTTEKQLVETFPSDPTDTNATIHNEHLHELYFPDACDTKDCRVIKSDIDLLLEEIMNENCVNYEFSEDCRDERKTEGIDMAEFKMEDIDIKPGIIDMESGSSLSCVKQENKVTTIGHTDEDQTIMVPKELVVLLKRDQFISDSSLSSGKQENKVTNISHSDEGNAIILSKELIVLLKREQFISRKKNLDDHVPRKHDNLLDMITSKIHQICDKCGYITTSNLLDHINSKHSQLENFQCNYCSCVFNLKGNLARHISEIHLKSRPYLCEDCKKTFARKCELDGHIVSFHQENVDLMRKVTSKIHKCDHCTFRCVDKMTMAKHMKTHGNIHEHSHLKKNFQCNYCSRFFHSKRNLAEHISSFHIKLGRYFCKGCTKTFTRKGKLDNHIVSFHQENVDLMRTVTNKIYKCVHCTYRCIDKMRMALHIKTHGNIHEHSQLKNFPCNYCSRVFYLKRHLADHISSNHLKLGRYFCEGCTKTFPKKRTLDNHIVAFHQQNVDLMRTVTNKIHKCDYCTYRCIDKMAMAKHIKTHGNIHEPSQLQNFQCNYCLHVFHLKSHLAKHISSNHLKLARCFCKDCKKTFTSKKVLDNHILSFHQENVDLMRTVTRKIYKCDHCTYRNINKTKITIHKRTHGNIHKRSQLKNFQCNYCSGIFHLKRHLAEHISSIHLKSRDKEMYQ